jgi:alpha-tubulin suppressor-like RCC1 family protein
VSGARNARARDVRLEHEGGVECWGNNDAGELGDGTTTPRGTPAPVKGTVAGIVQLASADQQMFALTRDGAAIAWGLNGNGQLGDGTTTYRPVPFGIPGLASGVVELAAGYVHSCARLASGSVLCWGSNATGELGDGTMTDHFTPAPTLPLTADPIGLGLTNGSTCALLPRGIECWGVGVHGELGDGTTVSRPTPGPVKGF